MSYTKITRLKVMLPESLEVYECGKNNVRKIMNDGDGFSVLLEDRQVRFFNNAVPLKIDWEWRSEQDGV